MGLLDSKKGIKGKDIKDAETKTSDLIGRLKKIRDILVGKNPTEGLNHLAEIVARDPANTEFRTLLGKLVAKLFSTVKDLLLDVSGILADLRELASAGHSVLLIRNEDILIGNLTQGFTVIRDELGEMQTNLNNLPQSADKEQLASVILGGYMEILAALQQLYPEEQELEKIYSEIEALI